MKFVSKQMHSYLDYPVALALMGLPFLLGLGSSNPLAFQISVIAGIAAFVLTIFTDHQLGLIRLIPFRIHLLVDLFVGIAFVAAPFLFSFSGMDSLYYWIFGGTVIAVVSLNKPQLVSA